MYKILVINPGSTSTKCAVYHDADLVIKSILHHSNQELAQFKNIADQYDFRKHLIVRWLDEEHIPLDFDVIVGRGGLIRPVHSGIYAVNESMCHDLLSGDYGEHASNLGGLIARDLADDLPHCRAVIVDPVVVDELQDVARVTGHPLIERKSIFHALNQKAVARLYAKEIGKPYESLNLIVAHLGGGISVGVHKGGLVIDVNNALNGDGPFSPERVGSVQDFELVDLCFSGRYTKNEIKKMMVGSGGLTALLGTNSAKEVEQRALSGKDSKAALVWEAMAYQVGKYIGGAAAVLCGKVDAILLTGSIAHSRYFIDYVSNMVEFIAPIKIYPGENELKAMADAALRLLNGEEKCLQY